MKRIITALLTTVAGVGLMSSAFAADLIVEQPAPMPGIVDVGGNWDGAYIGGNVGFASATTTFNGDELWGMDGWLAGAQVGYNFQSGDLVFGIEGSLDWSGVTGESNLYGDDVTRDINWTGDVTGKFGFAVSTLLFYGKAGVAFANTTSHFFGDNETQTHVGWTAGIGAAAMVSDEISIFAEYDYSNYGVKAYDNSGGDIGITSNAGKVGVNFHF